MLLKTIKKHWLPILATAYSLIVALFWLALRVNWSGISKALGADKNPTFLVMELPLLVCIFLWIAFVLSLASLLCYRKKWATITSLAISGAFTVLIAVVIALGAADYLQFILPKFGLSLLGALAITVFALLLFFPPVKNCKKCVALKCVCVALLLVATVFGGYGITLTNKFTYNAVVYAVEDTYQIVFSTKAKSIAWVEIDGQKYYDLYAGSMQSQETVHKVTVPQEKLDSAKAYTVNAQKMIYRGPFGGYKGKVISQSYTFRPVDSSDGLVYYSMSDVHSARKGAVDAAGHVQNLDFLVILGDSAGMIEYESDAQFSNVLAHDVTKGQIPVVYARGNHEIKGAYGEKLHRYVGSLNGKFYYYFTLSDVYGIVLDIGEDHDDDWWEYYGTAQFAQYCAEQTEMLKRIATEKPYQNYNYTLVACHIPINFVNYRHNHVDIKTAWTEQLNVIQPDLAVYGHQHDLYPFLEGTITHNEKGKLVYNSQFVGKEGKTYGGYMTDFAFNSFIVGRRGTTQTDEVGRFDRKNHIGMATYVDFATNTQKCVYLNSAGQKVSVYQPFVEGPAQTEWVLPLK